MNFKEKNLEQSQCYDQPKSDLLSCDKLNCYVALVTFRLFFHLDIGIYMC